MLWPVLRAELRAGLKRPVLYLCAGVFFFLAFQTIAIISPTASGLIRIGRLWHNSPYVVAKLITSLSVAATFVAAVLIAPAVHRDFQNRTDPFFLAAPITRLDYLLGRFAGAYVAAFFIFVAAVAGMIAAAFSIPSQFNGPFRVSAFIASLIILALPNLLLVGAISFAVATLSRRMISAYIAAVAGMMVLGVAQGISNELIENGVVSGAGRYALALAEPFGGAALQLVTAGWSPAEKNTQAIPLLGFLLVHRLLWLAVAIGLLVFVWRRFQPIESPKPRSKWLARWHRVETRNHAPSLSTLDDLRNVTMTYNMRQRLRQYAVLTRRELSLTVRHLAFIVLGVATIANLNSNFVGNVRAQGIYPRTGFFIEYGLRESSFVIILTIFFAGVLIWREREHRIHQIVDSQPVLSAATFGSKLSALLLMQAAYALLVIAFGIFVQTAFFRYTHIELSLHVKAVFGLLLIGWWTIAVVAFFIQTLSPNVYVGYALSGLVIAAAMIIPTIGVANGLWRPGFTPSYSYSDMNGFGHFALPLFWYRLYWSLACVCLVIVASSLWPRGIESLLTRLRSIRRSMTGRSLAALVMTALATFAVGAFIVYNTDVLNGATHTRQIENRRASYEHDYRRFLTLDQPAADSIDLSAAFFPGKRRLAIRGTMRLRNFTSRPIRDLHVTLLHERLLTIPRITIDAATSSISSDSEHGVTVFTLATPMTPGSTVGLSFEYVIGSRGFSDENADGHVVRNGSIVIGNDAQYFPQLGYQSELELSDAGQRLQHGLAGPSRMVSPVDDSQTLERVAPRWIGFSATVSTDADQYAVASGSLVRTWVDGNRRYATYTAQHPIGTFVLASGVYSRAHEQIGPVAVEILYHPDHAYNLRSMFSGVKCGLDYGADHFAPYSHKTLRIVELPMYTMSGNARAMSTVFLWGELGGFIRDIRRDQGIDRVYSTAAHETAHQWWGGSVRVLNEVLSDYVRLACLDHAFGDEATAEFVREGTRSYFGQREATIVDERPLRDGGQYDSRYALMWRLRRLVGEPAVNAALHDVVQQFAYRSDRTPTPFDVVKAIQQRAPANLQPIVDDLFNHITLHAIHAHDAWSQRLPDGRYRVTISADVRKSYGNSRGEDIPARLQGYFDNIEVGLYGKSGEKLALITVPVTNAQSELSVIVDWKPARLIIDPLGTLLDSDPSDNGVAVRSQ